MKRKFYNKNGITLIALVVTIIVLLILAGVSISMVMGDNGVVTKAKNANNDTEIGKEKEQIEMSFSDCKMSNIDENGTGYDTLVTASQLQNKINNTYGTDTVFVSGDVLLVVKYIKSGREYKVLQDGKLVEDDDLDMPIGISASGKLIDVSNWLYYYDAGKGGYVLAQMASGYTKAYIGTITDGKIDDEVPMYILALSNTSNISGSTPPAEFKPVVSMLYTFNALSNLKYKVEIPSTVTEIQDIYRYCSVEPE